MVLCQSRSPAEMCAPSPASLKTFFLLDQLVLKPAHLLVQSTNLLKLGTNLESAVFCFAHIAMLLELCL